MNEETQTQRFKFVLPIVKTRVEVRKDKDGNDKEVRIVQGVASSTDKDLHGDRMDPSAIKSMAESLKFHEVPLNSDHDTTWSAEIGPVTELSVDEDHNLIMEAELSEMSKANDLWYALTVTKKKLGLSIGGYVKEYEMVKEEATDEDDEETSHWYRLYKDIDLDHVAVTSSPANPKTWVSAISKSIDKSTDKLKIEKIEQKNNKKQSARDLARRIARRIQDAEADLILTLAETILLSFDPLHLQKVEEYLNILERSMSMDKKNVSLEAEISEKSETAEAVKDEAENTAALENESSEDSSDDNQEQPDAESTEEVAAENGESAEEAPEATEEVAEEATEDGSSGKESESNESESEVDEEDAESENGDEESEPTQKSEDSNDISELIKSLTETVKEVAKANEQLLADNQSLSKRLEELEEKPAERKGVEVEKSLGDEDPSEKVNFKELAQQQEEEIAELRKTHSNDPTLFSRIQKVRQKYALKAQGIQE